MAFDKTQAADHSPLFATAIEYHPGLAFLIVMLDSVGRLTRHVAGGCHITFLPTAVRIMVLRLLIIVVASSAIPTTSAHGQPDDTTQQTEFFEAKIRPVLIEHCYECHNSSETAEANLSLDHQAPMVKGGDSGGLFDWDAPDQSLLLQVIRHDIEGLEMPEGGGKLPASVIADLERWVKMGAPDPRTAPPSSQKIAEITSWQALRDKRMKWWSFQPIEMVEPPDAGAMHPVDQFVNHKLTAEGLTPSPVADKRTLLRRTTFALTGLPPTPQQTEKFIADESDAAFTALVDQLLASHQFGERWARHWMDWIRYAESHGSEGDPGIENAWMYRDYLIRSLNGDVGYDQLVKEHVAGDLLPNPRINESLQLNESLIATAHWRMVFHGFAPTDALDEKVRFTDDQIDTFSKSFLGLTVSCARCHNHKFDAISQADYYALFGILGSTRPGRAAADSQAKLDTNKQQLASLKDKIKAAVAGDWLSSLDELPNRIESLPPEGTMLKTWHTAKKGNVATAWTSLAADIEIQQQQQNDFTSQPRGPGWRFDNDNERWFAYGNGVDSKPGAAGDFMIAATGPNAIVSIFPSAVVSGMLSTKHAARLESPQVHLNADFDLWLNVTGAGNAGYRYAVQNYPRNGTVYPVKSLNDQPGTWRWQKFDLAYWNGDDIHIELAAAKDAPLLTKNEQRSWFGIREAALVPSGSLPPLNETTLQLSPLMDDLPAPTSVEELTDRYVSTIRNIVTSWLDGQISDSDALFLEHCRRYGLLSSELSELPTAARLVKQYRQLEAAVPVPTRVPTLTEWQGQDQRLLERGDHKQPREIIPRRFLEAIDDTPYRSKLSGRLQLADDVLRIDNPLTRRVIVNRVWHHLFGVGLVATPDNFGRLGAQPSHPELLDYLAGQFSNQHTWSLKSLIRFLVTSQTWQQVSTPSPESEQMDPQNQWLSHANVRRLEAEAIRDQLLMVSGNLNATMYGPPIVGTGNRRSVYVQIIRNRLDPFLATFDAPVPFGALGRRDITNVPAQSLMLLNDPFVVQAARLTASKTVQHIETSSIQDRCQQLWQQCLGRAPSVAELASSTALVESLRSRYAAVSVERATLEQKILETRQTIAATLSPIRNRLESEAANDTQSHNLKPIAVWDFEGDAKDRIGNLHATLKGTAAVDAGALILDGKGWAATSPLQQSLTEKSLEVTVQLANLNQRSGGAMTIQGTDGHVFDSIVFAERQPRHWMAGSNNFARTQDFNGPAEDTVQSKPVHIVVTYNSDGTVAAYRNGDLYGKAYKTGVQSFDKQTTQAIFGMRHGLSISPGRMLTGKLFEARLYDRALSAAEVKSAANGGRRYVTEAQVLDELPEPDRYWVTEVLRCKLKADEERLHSLGSPVPADQEWADLAHSLFNLKEFIYVR